MKDNRQFEGLCEICGKDVYLNLDSSNPDKASDIVFLNGDAVISNGEEYYYAIDVNTENMLQDLAKENSNMSKEYERYICTECINDMLEEKRILKCNSDIDTNDTIQKTELCAICGKVHVPVNKIEWYYDTPIIQGIFGSVTLDVCLLLWYYCRRYSSCCSGSHSGSGNCKSQTYENGGQCNQACNRCLYYSVHVCLQPSDAHAGRKTSWCNYDYHYSTYRYVWYKRCPGRLWTKEYRYFCRHRQSPRTCNFF